MEQRSVLTFDIEGDNLNPLTKNIWCVCLKWEGDNTVHSFREPEEFSSWLSSSLKERGGKDNPVIVVGHNILGYDLEALSRLWGVDYTVGRNDTWAGQSVEWRDTLVMSQFLNPDRRGGHSIANFGEILGYPKDGYDDFSQWSEELEQRCKQDVIIQEKVYHYLQNETTKSGQNEEVVWKEQCAIAAKLSFYLMSQQSNTGIGFDKEKAEALIKQIQGMMEEIEKEVLPQLPDRPLGKTELKQWMLPAKPFKSDGTLSHHMHKWLERTGAKLTEDEEYVILEGEQYKIVGGVETKTRGKMTLSNQAHLKDWLLEQGWLPEFWNFKRNPETGKPLRDEKGKLIRTTPKLQEGGVICPHLMELGNKGLIESITKWLSLRNRMSVLEGWLSQPRLQWDGRLSPGSSGFAATFRQKHSVVVNVPKAQDDVLLGKEMRELFCSSLDGYTLVGYDASGLENRVEAHYCLPYEGGKEHAEDILDGDPHTKNAFVFYPEELKALGWEKPEQGLKDVSAFKPFRQKSKNGRYALSYGAGGAKLASTLGKPESEGNRLLNAFWEANPALTSLKESLILHWKQDGKGKWVRGIDGRRIITRFEHSLVNSLFQSCGAIAMDYSLLYMDKWLGGLKYNSETKRPGYLYKGKWWVYRVGYFHDEAIWEVPEEIAGVIKKMGVLSIEKAGELLGLRVPLTGEGGVGYTWKDIH